MNRIYWVVFAILFFCLKTEASPHYRKHVVVKGETLFSISHLYGLKVNDLVKINPELKAKKEIKPGQQLNIPSMAHLVTEASRTTRKDTLAHKAKVARVPSTPDTPYSEEDKQVRTPADTKAALSTINNDNPVITAVKSEKSESPVGAPKTEKSEVPVAAEPKPEITENAPRPTFSIRTTSANPAEYASLFSQYSAHNFAIRRNRGAANYLADNSSGNPYLALYSGAETGSVIKVTNMMNNKSVFVKVVGKVPQADAGKEIILKLSHKVAQELGAIDEKFLVEVAGVPGN